MAVSAEARAQAFTTATRTLMGDIVTRSGVQDPTLLQPYLSSPGIGRHGFLFSQHFMDAVKIQRMQEQFHARFLSPISRVAPQGTPEERSQALEAQRHEDALNYTAGAMALGLMQEIQHGSFGPFPGVFQREVDPWVDRPQRQSRQETRIADEQPQDERAKLREEARPRAVEMVARALGFAVSIQMPQQVKAPEFTLAAQDTALGVEAKYTPDQDREGVYKLATFIIPPDRPLFK